MIVGQVGTTDGGTSKRRFQLKLSLTLGRRFALLLALFPVGGVIHHMSQESTPAVLSLVVVWGVTTLVGSVLDWQKKSVIPETEENLTVEAGLL